MAERRVSFLVDIDLSRYSKEAHASTMEKLGREIGKFATDLMKEKGYTVRQSKATVTLHYVRHVLPITIQGVRRMKLVKKAAGQ